MYTHLLPGANLFRLSLWACGHSETLSYPQRFPQIPNPICSTRSPESYSTYALDKASVVSLYFSQWWLPGPERAEGLTTLSSVEKNVHVLKIFREREKKKMYFVISICAQGLLAYIKYLPWNPNHLHSNSYIFKSLFRFLLQSVLCFFYLHVLFSLSVAYAACVLSPVLCTLEIVGKVR